MSEIVEDLLSGLDIVDVVSKYVSLKRAGVNFSGLCPFHNEKTPSFVVSPQKQIFKCFGCGKWGDAITFTKEIERIDFRDAAKILAKDANIDLEKYMKDTKRSKKLSKEYWEEKEMLKLIHKNAQQFFSEQLKNNSDALKYLHEKRKISDEMIAKFQISYAPDSYYDVISYLKEKWFSQEDILKSSLAREKNGEIFSFFRNRIMFPIRDTMGNIVAFSWRVVNPEDKPKYLNSSEHPAFEKSKILYGLDIAKQHIKEFESLIVVEGQMDVVGLNRLDFPIGIATSGTALTPIHISTIKRYTRNLCLLFDNDKAGHMATIRALKIAYQIGLFPKIITLPSEYKDVDDIANLENGKELFKKCFDDAKDAFSVVLERMKSLFDLSSPIEKQKFLSEVFSILLSISDIAIQDHYLQILAEKTMMRYEILTAQYKKYMANDGKMQIKQQQTSQNNEKNKFSLNREQLFSALLYNNFIEKYLWKDTDWWIGEPLLEMINLLAKYQTSSFFVDLKANNFSPENTKEREQLQLWREKNLEWVETEKQYQIILQLVLPLLQQNIKTLLANKEISSEEKQKILQTRAKLGR